MDEIVDEISVIGDILNFSKISLQMNLSLSLKISPIGQYSDRKSNSATASTKRPVRKLRLKHTTEQISVKLSSISPLKPLSHVYDITPATNRILERVFL